MSNYPDPFNGTNMDESATEEFEPVAFSECDDCGELLHLNALGYCKSCNDAANAFAIAAGHAMRRGHDPFTAGMIAAKELERKVK